MANAALLGAVTEWNRRRQAEQEGQQKLKQALMQIVLEAQLKRSLQNEDLPKRLLSVLSGLGSPANVFPQQQIEQIAPLSLGQMGGGEVVTPPGATYNQDQILSPQGQRIGEYLPGYEPTRQPEAITDLLRQRLGTTQEEALRKQIGLPKKERVSYKEQFRDDLQKASQRIMGGENATSVTNEMIQKYPSNMTTNIMYNLTEVGKTAKTKNAELRKQAIQALKSAGYPITEANIKSAMEQLREQ